MQNNAKVGGILSIISGAFFVFWLVWAVFMVYVMRMVFSEEYSYTPSTFELPFEFLAFMTVFYAAWGVFYALLGILGIVGGVFALKRKRWGLALAGAIAGSMTCFPCGIPAIIFTSLGKSEFSAQNLADSSD